MARAYNVARPITGDMRCAFLDLDGTVIRTDYGRYLIGVPSKLLVKKGAARDESEAYLLFRRRVREIIKDQILAGNYVKAFDWDFVINEALSSFGVEDRVDPLALLLKSVEDGRTKPYEDAIPAIRELRKNRRVCVMTGGLSKYQLVLMERLGITKEFDDVITTDRLGILKVRPEAFHKAMKECECDEAFHVGDSLSHDIFGAKSAGIKAVLVAREWEDLSGWDPLERPLVAMKRSMLMKKMSRDIMNGIIEVKVPDAIVLTLKELPPLARVL